MLRRSSDEATHTRQVKIMLDEELHDQGRKYADRLGMSFSFLVESLLKERLNSSSKKREFKTS